MAACQEVRQWITESVLVPVMGFITEAKEKCEEVRQSIEEQVSQPVERWISRQEQQCKELPWWNPVRWFCELVTIVVKIVEWVVVTVVKWIVTVVCQVVTAVVEVVVGFVLCVVAWVVTFVVCLFTSPLDALKSLLDLWGIVLDTVGKVVDLVVTLVDDIIGILNDLELLVDSLISSLDWLGVLIGWLKGLIQLARDLVGIARDIVTAVKDIALGILIANPCRILRGLADLGVATGRALIDTGFAPVGGLAAGPGGAGILAGVRVAGALVAGERDTVHRLELDNVIRDALTNAFGEGTARIDRALDAVGITAGPLGLPFTSDARRLFISSEGGAPGLRQLHQDGIIDLYAYAGYPSGCSNTINEADGTVVYAGTDLRVAFTDLETYLANGPGSVPEFHVFPISRAKFRQHLEIARRKANALGIRLSFPTLGTVQAMSVDHVPLNAGESNPPGDGVQQDLFGRMGRTGAGDDLSQVPTISHFHYVVPEGANELFGLTSWFRPSAGGARRSGVTYRSRSPDWVFRWVLAHELGHYWGLDDEPRSGDKRSLDEIMFTASSGELVSGSAAYEFLLGGGEPRFTLDDARSAWAWITTDGASLLP
jgi:hypothetical protein